ncbi:glycosyltransferase [Paenibacillus sp. JSM ZJ436]|uniref:glycosyltransferase n=1 Tax=Paenibacillus sp. JSM ZJ436 TaxID=3376190 RepID=UPI0037877894
MEDRRSILIYRDHLLPPSETFIRAQAEGLVTYRPYYMGSRLVQGIEIEEEARFVVNRGGALGRFKEIGFKLTGLNWGLARELRKLQPQLIHAHFGTDAALALPLADQLRVPLISTFHGYDATTRDEYAKKSYYTHRNYLKKRSRLQQEGALFIAVSDFIRRKLMDQGYPAHKIVRHYTGIDPARFCPDPAIQRKPIVLFVGRLVEVKGCAYLLQAMKTVQEQLPHVQLVVIGDGPLRSELEQTAKQSLRDYQFLGLQSPAEIKRWMNQAQVFCAPSVSVESGAEEGLGTVFLEASAMGLPVASFATGGIPEAVKHGETGLLAPEKDIKALSENILSMLTNELQRKRFSEQGRQWVSEQFDLLRQNRKLEEIYQSVFL